MDEIGLSINDYIIDENYMLGEGSFSKVYNAKCKKTGRFFAIKIIPNSKLNIYRNLINLEREIDNCKYLSCHPFIPTLYGNFADCLNHYLIFEKIEGYELFEYISDKGKLDENIAKKLFRKLVNIVFYIHAKGICHRDIKIENLIITKDLENIYLIDFGFSVKTIDKEVLKEKIGSFYNYPPEICKNINYNGFKYDSWTLGNCLYCMLTGYRAFSYEKSIIVEKIMKGKYMSIENKISKEAHDMINLLFNIDPKKRPYVSELLSHPWLLKD